MVGVNETKRSLPRQLYSPITKHIHKYPDKHILHNTDDSQHVISILLETTHEPRNVKIQQCYMVHNMTKHFQNDNVNQTKKQEKDKPD